MSVISAAFISARAFCSQHFRLLTSVLESGGAAIMARQIDGRGMGTRVLAMRRQSHSRTETDENRNQALSSTKTEPHDDIHRVMCRIICVRTKETLSPFADILDILLQKTSR